MADFIEYDCMSYVQSAQSLQAKIAAIDVLENLLLNSMAAYLGGSLDQPVQPIPPIYLGASAITGMDPVWQTDLTAYNIPPVTSVFNVYLDINGSGDFQLVIPVYYDNTTKILSNLQSPSLFPNQRIKIITSAAIVQPTGQNMGQYAMYEIDDGQVRIKTGFRSIEDLVKANKALEAMKNLYINKLNGRSVVLRDKRTFNPGFGWGGWR